ncbi:MAG: iron-sulfur cluster assembly protein [Hyphomicrobium sp.]
MSAPVLTAPAVTATEASATARHAEIWQALATVVDPELDEPVTDMGFISRIDVDASDCVHVDFRLPTYWCAANFAFLMASDMRDVVLDLPWVKGTTIVLGEHMYTEKINKGIAEGLSFEETFGDEANGNLDEVRRTFLVKAYQRRQEALIRHLAAQGMSADVICAMTISDLAATSPGGKVSDEASGELSKLVARYMDRREVIGPFTGQSLAFVSAEDQSLTPPGLTTYLAGLRRIRANAEFNGALCRGLLAVRFDMDTPLPPRPQKACRSGAPTAVQSTNIE